jgi:hypothetical protein
MTTPDLSTTLSSKHEIPSILDFQWEMNGLLTKQKELKIQKGIEL